MKFYIKRPPLPSITQEQLKEILTYDPETGIFTWKVFRSWKAKAGDIAGYIDNYGYRKLQIQCKMYPAHRLAFLYMLGRFTDSSLVVDHINGDKGDNRWCNLREATYSVNSLNRRSPCERNAAKIQGDAMKFFLFEAYNA